MVKHVVFSAIGLCLAGCVAVVPVPVSIPASAPSAKAAEAQSAKPARVRSAPRGTAAARVGPLVNAERRARGLAPLSHNRLLDQVATRHAHYIQGLGQKTHISADGKTPHKRLKAAGYRPCRTSENTAEGFSQPDRMVRQFMGSSGHRANILDPKVVEYGVGHASEEDYWVLMFSRSGC